MDNNTINTQFSKVILSLGYTKDELVKYLKIFDLSRKIEAITSTYSILERKDMVVSCLEELKNRNSLMYLLFLKNTLETMAQLNENSKNIVYNTFLNNQGIEVVEFGFISNNSDFLNNLLELTIFIFKNKQNIKISDKILLRILQKFDLINKPLIYTFINLDINKQYLLMSDNSKESDELCIKSSPRCYCNTFLKKIVDLIFTQKRIGPEVKFLVSNEFQITKILTINQFIALKEKFIENDMYNSLLSKIKNEKFEEPNYNAYSIDHSKDIRCSKIQTESIQDFDSSVTFIDPKAEELSKLKTMVDEMHIELQKVKVENNILKCKAKEAIIPRPVSNTMKNIVTATVVSNSNSVNDIKKTISSPLQKAVGTVAHNKFVENISAGPAKVSSVGFGIFSKLKENKSSSSTVTVQQISTKEQNTVVKINVDMPISKENTNSVGLISKTKTENTTLKNVMSPVKSKALPGSTLFAKVKGEVAVPVEKPIVTKSKGFGLFSKSKVEEHPPVEATSAIPKLAPKGLGLFKNLKPTVNVSAQQPESAPQKSRFGFGSKAKAIKPTLTSDKSYLGIKWKKANKTQNHIFSKINYEQAEKFFNLNDFAQFEIKTLKKEAQTHNNQKQVTVSTPSIIDPKKSYALNIALGRVKLTNTELINSILKNTCDNENLVKQLIIYYPTNDEYSQISSSSEHLGRAELLFKEIKCYEQFLNALISMRFKLYFYNRNYIEITESITTSLSRMIKSNELLNLFAKILVIGNIMNSNSFNGNAEGFTLDSLSIFSSKEIVELIRSKVDLHRLFDELLGNPNPEKIELITTCISIETLVAELGEAKSLFRDFVDQETTIKYEKTLVNYEELNKLYKELQGYFGESDDSFITKIESFLKALKGNC